MPTGLILTVALALSQEESHDIQTSQKSLPAEEPKTPDTVIWSQAAETTEGKGKYVINFLYRLILQEISESYPTW